MDSSKLSVDINCDILKILGLQPEYINNYKQTKSTYKKNLNIQKDLNKRRQIHLAYELLCNKNLKTKLKDGKANFKLTDLNEELIDTLIILEDIEGFQKFFEIKNNLDFFYQKDCMSRSLLYKAVKYESFNFAKDFISIGIDVNDTQVDGSTALHCAAFYSRINMIKLLLVAGGDRTIKNKYGTTCLDEETDNEQVKALLEQESPLLDFLQVMRAEHKNMKISISQKAEKEEEIQSIYLENPFEKQESEIHQLGFFHGTKLKNVKSILKEGFKKPGEFTKTGEKIVIPENHIKSQIKVKGIANYAKATFISRSPFYASHGAYSESVPLFDQKMKVLIHCQVDQSQYTEHSGTISNYQLKQDEIRTVETRITNPTEIKVLGVYFVKENLIEEFQNVKQFEEILEIYESRVLQKANSLESISYIYTQSGIRSSKKSN